MTDDNAPTPLAILGAAGRMGRLLLEAARQNPALRVVAAVDRPGAAAAPGGPPLSVDAAAAFAAAEVAIDFTAPAATLAHVRLAAATGKALVIGTTGLDVEVLTAIETAARRAPILRAANMSLGVTLLQALVRQSAARLDLSYDIEIVEMHHRGKVDAPSGTALALGEAAAAGRGVRLDDWAVKSRDGLTGPRREGTIGFATLRGGDVAGDHCVVFAGAGERLELSHRASSREVFVQGALRAAQWLRGRPAGLYSMRDVLGLET